jgi:dTDP-4-amino-4,6-dideoxygalactose transaminase
MIKTDIKVPFHQAAIGDEEINAVVDTLKSGWLTMGPKTIAFEEQFSERMGGIHCISMNSATGCLHLALKAVGLQAGDEVILPTTTFVSTAEVVTYFGATPVLCDIRALDHNIDTTKLEALITPKTKVIIPVHFSGIPCDMDAIAAIAKKHDLKIIEDAAHSLPSYYKDIQIGSAQSVADITCFSFYATKTLATGEGGMATTNNDDYALSMKRNRLHGISKDAWDRYSKKGRWFYEVVDNGFKYNMTDVAASLGQVQLRRLDDLCAKRQTIAETYNQAFKGCDAIQVLQMAEDVKSSWHLYVIKVADRDAVMEALGDCNIGTSLHFIPVHHHPYYKDTYQYNVDDFSSANMVYDQSISLPIFPDMTPDQVQHVIDCVLHHVA